MRNTTRMATCAVRTVRRPRRSRISHSRYCTLAPGIANRSTFDMHFELLPESVEVSVEFRRVARLERGWTALVVTGCETYWMIGLYLTWATREHDDAFGHADRFRNIVRDQDRRLPFAAQNFGNLVRERKPGLRIKCRERLIEQDNIGLGAERACQRAPLAHSARKLPWQMVQELAKTISGQELFRTSLRRCYIGALNFRSQNRVFQDRAPFEQVILLEHVADLARRPADRPAVDQNRAGRRLENPRDQRQQCAFATPALTDNGDELARRDGEADIF